MKIRIAEPLERAAAMLGLSEADLEPRGRDALKLAGAALSGPRRRPGEGRLVLVSGITPTRAGAGKTTTAIGLVDALVARGESAVVALREPSQGPCFGFKGGGTGGGQAQLVDATAINLHFTGDIHAVTAAHNLLAALIDNHLHYGNALGMDPRLVAWPRVLDVNDRSLRRIVLGLGDFPREGTFAISAASEVMAMLCLAEDDADLRVRLARTVVGFTYAKEPITAGQLDAVGPMLALLRDALRPNLVRTAAGSPALVHGGPFANIAHGCSSVIATRAGLRLADWVVTEAGFGFDLGAEKFFDIKCASAGLDAAAVVLVATLPALRRHGGVANDRLDQPAADAVRAGLANLMKHVESIRLFGERPVVALNRFPGDTEAEIAIVGEACQELSVPFAVSTTFEDGPAGAADLAEAVIAHAEASSQPFQPLYASFDSALGKIERVASQMYGASRVVLSKEAERDLRRIESQGWGDLPVCIAKTPHSLSEDPRAVGRPDGFDLHVRRVLPRTGAGFLVVLCGDIENMPGLPRRPRAADIDVVNGEIRGL